MEIRSHSPHTTQRHCDLVSTVLQAAGVDSLHGFVVIDAGDLMNNSLLSGPNDFALYRMPHHALPRDLVPSHISSIIEDDDDVHLIWLSERILDEENIHFAWIVAHECGHAAQNAQGRSLASVKRAIQSLRRKPDFLQLPGKAMGEHEVDSDLVAMQITNTIFGQDAMDDYFKRSQITRCPFVQYPRFLRELALNLATAALPQ